MSKLPTLGPFPLGVDNRKSDHALSVSVGRGSVDLLRSATNVDLSDEGRVRRRAGYTLVHAGTNVHSFWSDGRTAFFADGASLRMLTPSLGSVEIRGDLIPGKLLSFCEAGGIHYYTGSGLLGMVQDGVRRDFTPALAATPFMTAISGALPPGRYQMVFTYFSASGESAATLPQVLDLPIGGGVQVDDIQAPPSGCALRAYMTSTDGEVFGRIDLDVSGTSAQVVSMPALGARCQSLLLAPMPSGSIVRFSNARLLVAVGNLLCYSEPFAPGLFNPSKNYVPFSAPITLIEPCGTGVFVVADKTYWLDGEITQAPMTVRLPYGAAPGSGTRHPDKPETVFWVSDKGLIQGTADGAAVAVQEERLALSGGSAGAALVREQEGLQHVITALRDPMATVAACSSYFDAEIIRKGNVL